MLVPILQKLASGEHVRIGMIGGSMQAGSGCRQPYSNSMLALKPTDCSWMGRVVAWMRAAFPKAQIQFDNYAKGGTPSLMFLSDIHAVVHEDTDVLVVDTVMNDANIGAMVHEATNQTVDPVDVATISAEEILRHTHRLARNAVILFAINAHPKYGKVGLTTNLVQLAKHYHQPYLDFHALNIAMTPPSAAGAAGVFWKCCDKHPPWWVHEQIANIYSMVLSQTYVAASECGAAAATAAAAAHFGGPPPSPPPREKPAEIAPELFVTNKYPGLFAVCNHPLSRYSAKEAWTVPGSPMPTVKKGNFTLYADVPGKPGWISSQPGSTLQFKLRFGLHPKLSISYLRSYEGFGVGQIEFPDNKRRDFDSWWERGVSQTFTSTYDAHSVFRIKPSTEMYVDIKFLRPHTVKSSERFKMIEVLSC